MTEDVKRFCGFCAIIGAPNAGKSTLLNQLIGAKLAIVTHKVQTTRARLKGILIEATAQIILVDTPGIFDPKRKLDEAMVATAWEGACRADVTVFIIDACKGLGAQETAILTALKKLAKIPVVLVLNKIDLIAREKLLSLVKSLNEAFGFAAVFMISALKGEGVEDLKQALVKFMPEGPWLYPPDQISDIQERMIAAELTREQIYLNLHQELPYASTVETERFEEQKDGSIKIHQVIYVQRDTQKKIVLGKGGQTIKIIGSRARIEIEKFLQHRVHLFLFVKVRAKWDEDPERLRMMGLS